MSDSPRPPVASDPTLVRAIRRFGTFDPTGCYQCGSCTVSCELNTDAISLPRRSLRRAMLGLRGSLLADLEPWICHDCGECAEACPRHANPRAGMQTLRRYLTAQYDWTGISSKVLGSRAWYFGSLAGVAAITFALVVAYHIWYIGLPADYFASTALGPAHMFPTMTWYTRVVMLLPLLLLVTHGLRMWSLTMRGSGRAIPVSAYAGEAWTYLRHSVSHTLMRRCPERGRWFAHWLLALGTVIMLVVKTLALTWFQTDEIHPVLHPQRWLGYVAAALMLYGLGSILACRLWQRHGCTKPRPEDLVFPVLLLLTAITGLGVHILRYTGLAYASHVTYALHVVIATPMLLVEMSFGRWSHMIYRPLALYFQAVRERAATQADGEAVRHAA